MTVTDAMAKASFDHLQATELLWCADTDSDAITALKGAIEAALKVAEQPTQE